MQPRYSHTPPAQINYMLGDAGRSYVVGFGKEPPTTPFPQVVSIPADTACACQVTLRFPKALLHHEGTVLPCRMAHVLEVLRRSLLDSTFAICI